jgi:hypothetical protein
MKCIHALEEELKLDLMQHATTNCNATRDSVQGRKVIGNKKGSVEHGNGGGDVPCCYHACYLGHISLSNTN